MEFLIEMRYEDLGYNALVYWISTFVAETDKDATAFLNELVAAFRRRNLKPFVSCNRIDHDTVFKQNAIDYIEFRRSQATASFTIDQFLVEAPDQDKSLFDNLTEKFLNGKNCVAQIGNTYNIPVRVIDKQTRNPITDEVYYFSVEHLIPKN